MERGENYTSTKLNTHVCSDPEATTNDSSSKELLSGTSTENHEVSNCQPEDTEKVSQSSEIDSNICSESSTEKEVAHESQHSDFKSKNSAECQGSPSKTERQLQESHDDMNKMENKENEGRLKKKTTSPYDKPVYRELSRINGEINRLKMGELKSTLKALKLDTRGRKDVLQRRLKSYHREQKLGDEDNENPSNRSNYYYDYYMVIDFEATCDASNAQDYRHEIIEFPAVLVCTKRCRIVKEFHSYVHPAINPKLTSFCTSLTGITQDNVNFAPMFPEVLQKFEEWLDNNHLNAKPYKFAVVTDGPWDMGRFLFQQCNISKVPYPSWGITWINIRKTFCNFYNSKRMCLKDMLTTLGMKFEGQPHCGLDDSRNIARLSIKLLKDGANLRVNERIHLRKDGKYNPREQLIYNISRHNFNGMKKKLISTNKSDKSKCESGETGSDKLKDAECEESDKDPEHNELWLDPSNMEDFPILTPKS
ncbi:3'-5' exoribonuclease 1-like isoform X2 [Panulirus ornatus]